MKKLFSLSLCVLTFFATTIAATPLDNKGKDYWLVKFGVSDDITPKEKYSLILLSDDDGHGILLDAGDIGKLPRTDDFSIKIVLQVKTSLGKSKFFSFRQKFLKKLEIKNHYITMKLVRDPLKLWLKPKLKIRSRKENSNLELQASKRLQQLRAFWDRKYKYGCKGIIDCRKRNRLVYLYRKL